MCIWVFLPLCWTTQPFSKLHAEINLSVNTLAKVLKFLNSSLATHSVRIAIVGTKRSTQRSSWITRSHRIQREHFSTPAMLLPWGSMGKLTFCVRKAVSLKTGKMHKKILQVKTYLQYEHLRIVALHRAFRTQSGITNITAHRKGN